MNIWLSEIWPGGGPAKFVDLWVMLGVCAVLAITGLLAGLGRLQPMRAFRGERR